MAIRYRLSLAFALVSPVFLSSCAIDEAPSGGPIGLTDSTSAGDGMLTVQARQTLGAAHGALRTKRLKETVEKVLAAPESTPFERGVLALYPTLVRLAEISALPSDVRTSDEERVLTAKIRASQAVQRLAELTTASPMSCSDFNAALEGPWAAVSRAPEAKDTIEAMRAGCASGDGFVAGVWSGFAYADWSARIVLGDEELPRSDFEHGVSAVFGVLAIVVGGILLATPAAAVGVGLLVVGQGALSWGVSDDFFFGLDCDLGAEGSSCTAGKQQDVVADNGCVKGLNACSTDAACPTASYCTHGCCEAVANGLSKQENGLSTYTIIMSLPSGYKPNQIGVWASGGVYINDRSRVMNADGSGASVISADVSSTSRIGADAFVGPLITDGALSVSDRATINGPLTASGTVSYGSANTVLVTGPQLYGSAATFAQRPPVRLIWLTAFKDSGLQAVSLEPDTTRVLSPGDYGAVSVKSRAHLQLAPGIYHFDGLSTEPDSVIDLAGTKLSEVNVRGYLSLKGKILQTDSGGQTLMLTYLGGSAYVTQTFAGTLVAPYAAVDLDVAGAEMRASVWGRTVELHQGGRIRLSSSSVWDRLSDSL